MALRVSAGCGDTWKALRYDTALSFAMYVCVLSRDAGLLDTRVYGDAGSTW